MSKKKILIIALVAVLSIGTIAIWATGTQDYRDVAFEDSYNKPVYKPTAQFSLTLNEKSYNSPAGTDLDSFAIVVNATVGDTVTIKDLSHSNRGKSLKAWDFQYTRPEGKNEFIKTKTFERSYTLDIPGTYTFSLCVRDTVEDEGWTNYWGNWSDNGNHQVIGHNPGKDLNDPTDDFDGYWYFTRIVVIVREKSYTLQEKHIDTNSGAVLYEELHEGITQNSYTTNARTDEFSDYEFVGSRAGYTWADIATGITQNIASRTANFDSTHTNAFHYYYYKKITPPPPPPGKATIVVYYKDSMSGVAVYDEDTSLTDVDYGTYTIEALPAPEKYTFDSIKTPSPQIVTVDVSNRYKEVTFYYKPDPSTYNKPPVAIASASSFAYIGDEFLISGGASYDPDGKIVSYEWDIGDLEVAPATGLTQKDGVITGRSGYVWAPCDMGYATVTLTVTDDKGATDSDSAKIEIREINYKLIIDALGKLKQNRKITYTVANSIVPKHYKFVDSIVNWTLTPLDSSSSNLRYNGMLTGVSKDILSKVQMQLKASCTATIELKDGEYRQRLIDFGESDLIPRYTQSAEKTISIAFDQPPLAKIATAAEIIRNPADANNATFVITNTSYSVDGDTINKAVCLLTYDSDNDGNYNEEISYYSTNGTTWLTTNKTLSQIKAGFDIFSITTASPEVFTYKSKYVGMYRVELIVTENIPDSETIKEFLTNSDYKRDSTFE